MRVYLYKSLYTYKTLKDQEHTDDFEIAQLTYKDIDWGIGAITIAMNNPK